MKTIHSFRLEMEFQFGRLDPKRAGAVVDVIEGYSTAAHSPWTVKCWKSSTAESVVAESQPSALIVSVAQGQSQGFRMSREVLLGPPHPPKGHVEEAIYFSRRTDSIKDVIAVGFVVRTPLERQEPLFAQLCTLLAPRHCMYVPCYDGPAGSQGMSLESALERDYGMYGDRPENARVKLAKAIAPLLPRIGFSVLDPSGLPNRLGWLNYWHPDVAGELGFPDPDKDARILPLCQRTESGAWIVRLTEESLDLTRPDHVEAIAWAYWRFDKIGKRMQPTAKRLKPRVKKADADAAARQGKRVFVLRERDENGQWWGAVAEPIHATDREEALRTYFAKIAHSRAPRPSETLNKLRKGYDRIAIEVGMVRGDDIDAVEAEP